MLEDEYGFEGQGFVRISGFDTQGQPSKCAFAVFARHCFVSIITFKCMKIVRFHSEMHLIKFTNFDEIFPEWQQFLRRGSKYARFSNFLGFRGEYCWIFRKWFSKNQKAIRKINVRKNLFFFKINVRKNSVLNSS